MTPETITHLVSAALAGITALLVTLILTPVIRSIAVRGGWVGRPTGERWGRRMVSRLGGVAMFLGFLIAVLAWIPLDQPVVSLLIGVGLVFGLGLYDDLRRLPPYTKLMGQLLIGCVVVLSGIRIELIHWAWLSIPLSVVWFVLLMNAFNLLDNMDGLAAGVGAIAASVCAFHAVLASQWVGLSLSVILCGICLGFLWFNFSPARIYMGDSGSHLLGLSLAVLTMLGSWHRSAHLLSVLVVPVLVLALPIFDTCFVVFQRLVHQQHPFVGGRDHVSHRLAILGLSTRQTVLTLYVVSAAIGLLSVVSAGLKLPAALLIWIIAFAVLALIGCYLAQVTVYRVEMCPSAPPHTATRPATIIDTMLLHKRRLVEILVDFSLVSGAYVFAHLLRYEGTLDPDIQQLIMQSLPILLVIKLLCFSNVGLYRGMWRYCGLADLMTMFKAVTLSSLLSAMALLYLWRFQGYSRAVLIVDWMLTLLAVGGSRVIERLLDEWIHQATAQGVPALIIGAGDTGVRVLRSLTYESQLALRVVGFLDDDRSKWRNQLHGLTVFGGRTELSKIVDVYRIQHVLVAIADPPGDLLRDIQQCCEPRGVTWRVVTAGVTAVSA